MRIHRTNSAETDIAQVGDEASAATEAGPHRPTPKPDTNKVSGEQVHVALQNEVEPTPKHPKPNAKVKRLREDPPADRGTGSTIEEQKRETKKPDAAQDVPATPRPNSNADATKSKKGNYSPLAAP